MSQKFLFFTGPADQLAALTSRLTSLGFAVGQPTKPAMAVGVHVRVREESGDEAEVAAAVATVAPDAKQGPPKTPTKYIVGYRES